MTVAQTFHCPTCGAPLHNDGGLAPTIQCPYCRSTVVVPEEMRARSARPWATRTGGRVFFQSYEPAELASIAKQMAELVQAGKKVAAIKLFHEKFGVGLKEAKEVVDELGAGHLDEVNQALIVENERLRQEIQSTDFEGIVGITNQLGWLVREGRKLEAIKLYRQTFDVSLKDAKDAVERLEAGNDISFTSVTVRSGKSPQPVAVPNRYGAPAEINPRAAAGAAGAAGCFGVVLVIIILMITAIPILFALAQPGGPLAGVWARVNPFAYGRVTLAFGGEGTGQGLFQDPRTIGLDADGNIYVGEYDGGRLQVFTSQGQFRSLWPGEEDRYLEALGVSREGSVYMVYQGEIYRFDGATGEALGALENLQEWHFDDVKVTPDGGLIAVAQGETILRLDARGRQTLVIPAAVSTISGDSELDCQVAVDGLGNIYVLATFNRAVFKFAPDGRFLTRIGSEGEAPGQFRSPHAIAVDGLGRVYVSDLNQIEVFDSEGRYLDRIQLEQGVAFGLVFNENNELFAATNAPRVLRFEIRKP